MKEQIISDLANKLFSFKFDEITTNQIKKQYSAFVTYFSNVTQTIVTAFCGSLFIGHRTAEDLVSHFFEFLKRYWLNTFYLLSLGMDGPILNKSFASKLKAVLNAIATLFIDIGTCPLHTANNTFSDDLKYLKDSIDLDEFGIYFHFFFKHSTARREDYEDVSSITEVTLHFVLRHCQWRLLSFDNVLVRIVEQFENLNEYFIVKLPTLPDFKGKNGIQNTERH